MAVSKEDVLHIARLARLGVSSDRADELTRELSAILAHMEVLSQVDTGGASLAPGAGAGGTPLRPDVGVAPGLASPLDSVAPSMRDGFFIVPRLATHEDAAGIENRA